MNDVTAPLQLTGVHLQPYNEIIRPGQIWKISKYFLRRWTPYLPASSVWLVIGARQESYFNGNRPWFTAYDGSLAAAAGIHVRSFRRAAKKEIAEGRGALATFIHKTGDPAYVRGQPVPKQTETRYEVRLDDPLVPADAAHLAGWLRRHAPATVTPGTVAGLLAAARAESPAALRAAQIDPEADTDPALLTVADVVTAVFPAVAAAAGWREAADRLHTHIVAPQLYHLESQYLRHRWLGELGAGPALLLVYLRSLCYHNPQTGETRDEVALRSGTLEQLFQKSSVTLRAWFRRLEERVGETHPHGPFLEVVGTQKLPTQQVETTYRLNLLTPLHPDDLPRYRALVRPPAGSNGSSVGARQTVNPLPEQEPPPPRSASPTAPATNHDGENGDAGESFVSHVTQGHESFVSHDPLGGQSFVSHGKGGEPSFVSYAEPGEQSFDSGWPKKWHSYKYYKDLFAALVSSYQILLLEKIEQQQQWEPAGPGSARHPLAAAAFSSLEGLLDHFGVQGGPRQRICRAGPAPAALVAWYLYAEQEAGLDHPARYMIKQVWAGIAPPPRFLALARLSWEQWRAYAAACTLAPWLAAGPDTVGAGWPHFAQWRTLYGHTPPVQLPFGVGEGLAALADAFHAAERSGPAPEKETAAGAHWRATLQALELQMTRATFNAWLRDARCLGWEEAAAGGDEIPNVTYVVQVRNEAAQAWLSHRLRPVVVRELSAVVGRPVGVRFILPGEEGAL